jgi:26S proteasome regulatory subunit N9
MQYLAHTTFAKFPAQTRLALALDVATAALVAEDVFNFGDVLRYEVIQELGTSPAHKWLLDLLVVFNDGDVKRFNALLDAHRAAFEASATLVASIEVLKQKIALLSFVRVVFDRPPEQRHIPFSDIAAAALLSVDQVEWLVMRAFSKKLARGTIDEIEQVISVTWLMPRVLDAGQTKTLGEKLMAWSKSVDQALLLELQVPELFSSV